MSFLFYNKDILFEISKYLSRHDMTRLKKSFVQLSSSLNPILNQRNISLAKRRSNKKKYSFTHWALSSLFNQIFELGDDKFLLYNRSYDSRKRILTADVDYRELLDIYSLGDEIEYDEFVEPIILSAGIVLKLRNAHHFYSYTTDIRGYHESALARNYGIFVSNQYMRYLVKTEKIYDFIDQNLGKLSMMRTYFYFNNESNQYDSDDSSEEDDDFIRFFLDDDITELIWYYLPKKNRDRLIKDLGEWFNEGEKMKELMIHPIIERLLEK